ncbi:potassium channel AKT1 [Cercophora samala]|uniref:Potassium channel AKT1 n=1 Tax=Cercophora samala TaxID=330535 RepID=A0AA39ZAZ0_9PEZI|nr:potassium channel AKT1 [Cercophora samala]
MCIGVGAADIAKLTATAWKLYKSYKDAPEDFSRLQTELMSLHAILSEISDTLAEMDELDTSRRNRLAILTDGCEGVLQDMQAVYARFDSLGTQQQRTWQRMRMGVEDLSGLRDRLVSCCTMLTVWNVAVINSSTSRINKKLDKFVAEVRAGLREGSVITTPDAAQTIDSSPDVWNELRRELEDVGISAAVVEEKKEYILEWLKEALADGGLDEDSAEEDDAHVSSLAPLSTGRVNKRLHSVDSGYGGSDGASSFRGSISTKVDMHVANNAFEEELRRQRAQWHPEEGKTLRQIRTPTESTMVQVKVRRRTHPVVMIKKLFKNDTDIIEAASGGQVEQVAKLISLGMDVNARDRWGWTALSMCGYGGYKEIARMLLDHGADLDNVDVDGDTPTSLAIQRGHAELVVMFDEEREARDLKIRETDTEVPRRVHEVPA